MPNDPVDTDQADTSADERPFLTVAWPFLVAVAIVIIAILAVVVMHIVKPANERLTDSAKITRTLNDYYSAISDLQYDKYRATFCTQDTLQPNFLSSAQFTDKYTGLREKNGQIKMEDPSEVNVDGDVATANSHWAYNKGDTSNHTDAMKFLKSGSDWKICNSVPAPQK